jgi:hypothetical protein
MSTIIYLIVSLLIAGFSFYVLYFNKFSFLRMPAWLLFYLSALMLAIIWLQFFFPEISYEGTISGFTWGLALLGKISLVLFVIAGFSFWVYLRYKKSDFSLDKIIKTISGLVTVVALIIILFVSLIAFGLRTYQEAKRVAVTITEEYVFSEVIEANVVIPKGGTLCGTLHMTKQYALQFAEINNLKYHYHGDKLIVLVQPGDEFMPVGKLWMPVKKVAK